MTTLTQTAAGVAGLALVATFFIVGSKRLLPSLAGAIALGIVAAVIIHIIA